MTEPTAPAAPIEATAPEPAAPEPAAPDDPNAGAANREAARYRTALRAAEADRDALAGRLGTLQRREAERLAAEHLADGADLWRADVQLAELLGADGDLDAEAVAKRVREVVQAHPAWARPGPATGFRSGAGSGGPAPRSWASLLNEAAGG